jgi:hypothetical protein
MLLVLEIQESFVTTETRPETADRASLCLLPWNIPIPAVGSSRRWRAEITSEKSI